jgi:predicted GIY-YIG superfamily endonuclease
MVTIYCIEDINNVKYVGSTTRELNTRLTEHRYDRKRNPFLSSKDLNLDNCKIYELEKCEDKVSHDREKYWINKIDCVNKNKFHFSFKNYENTRRKELRNYQKSWGGDYRTNNNLLAIDINLFI